MSTVEGYISHNFLLPSDIKLIEGFSFNFGEMFSMEIYVI